MKSAYENRCYLRFCKYRLCAPRVVPELGLDYSHHRVTECDGRFHQLSRRLPTPASSLKGGPDGLLYAALKTITGHRFRRALE